MVNRSEQIILAEEHYGDGNYLEKERRKAPFHLQKKKEK
jgi:hypothetical protein